MSWKPITLAGICAVALAGCGSSSSPPPPPAAYVPDPQPDHIRLISENLKSLFSESAQPHNIMVSELRQVVVADGPSWGACLKVNATGMSGQPTSQRTVVVVFRRNTIIERRPANPDDCVNANYRPLPR